MFGHQVRGPLQKKKKKWLQADSELNLLDYVSEFKSRLSRACEIARDNLKDSQTKMKEWYCYGLKPKVEITSYETNNKVTKLELEHRRLRIYI